MTQDVIIQKQVATREPLTKTFVVTYAPEQVTVEARDAREAVLDANQRAGRKTSHITSVDQIVLQPRPVDQEHWK